MKAKFKKKKKNFFLSVPLGHTSGAIGVRMREKVCAAHRGTPYFDPWSRGYNPVSLNPALTFAGDSALGSAIFKQSTTKQNKI